MIAGAAWVVSVPLSASSPISALAVSPNALVNDPELDTTAYDTQTQPVVLVMPAGRVLVAYLDTGSLLGWTSHFNGWSLSTDGGATFVDRGALPGGLSGLADGYELSGAYDPIAGRAFLATTQSPGPGTVLVYRSEEKGASFLPPVPAFGVNSYHLDFPSIAVDSGGVPGPSRVYVLARDAERLSGMLFNASSDGGLTFPPGAIRQLTVDTGLFSRLLVTGDGTVHAFWYSEGSYPPALVVRTSHDWGGSFMAPRRVATLNIDYYGTLPIEFFSSVHPAVAADPIDPDFLVVAYADTVPGFDRAEIFVVTSADAGLTWAAPVRVNADPGTNDQFSPALAFSPDGTRLFVGWYDRRRDPRNWEVEYWGRIAGVLGHTLDFGPDFPISTASFPPVYRQDPGWSWSMSDYEQAGSDAEFFYAAWSDARNPDPVHPHQHDIRLAKIPIQGPGPILERAGASFVSGSCQTQNRGPDPGERVVERLCVANWGTEPTGDLTASLQESGGVLSPGPPQSLGSIPEHGGQACGDFEFTVDPQFACGAALAPELVLSDTNGTVGDLTYAATVGETGTAIYGPFANPAPVALPPNSPAEPYPSSLTVTGVPRDFDSIQVQMNDLESGNTKSIGVALARPGGEALAILGDVGTEEAVSGISLLLEDEAARWLPWDSPIESGAWRPTVLYPFAFFPPMIQWPPVTSPAGVMTLQDEFGHQDPNGVWSLFVENWDEYYTGDLAGGWGLSFRKRASACRCSGPFFAGDFEVGDTSQWDSAVGLAAGSAR